MWDNSVLILAIVNAFAVPVELSIYEDLSNIPSYQNLDLLINIVFMVDLAICFNTAYYNNEGQLVFSRKKIAENYITGMFFIDFFSSIPYSLLKLNQLKFLKILKIARITRIAKVINKSEMDEQTKAFVKILKLIFDLFLLMHLLGCAWFFIINMPQNRQQWSPPFDFMWVSRPVYNRFYDTD